MALNPTLGRDWSGRLRENITSGDINSRLSAADEITSTLGGRQGGEYRLWLRDTVGRLEVTRPEILEATLSLGCTVATTNYDTLLESQGHLRAVPWTDAPRSMDVARGAEQGVLHLHGVWDEPESVVLGIQSYERALGSPQAQALQHALSVLRTIVMVGFGAGVRDPNFRAWRAWQSGILAGAGFRHYRLVSEDEVEGAFREHAPEERVVVIPYGAHHVDLAPYLNSLRPSPHVVPGLRTYPEPGPVIVATNIGADNTLEVLTDGTAADAQVLVDGTLVQVVGRDDRRITAVLPSGVTGPVRVALLDRRGQGPEREAYVPPTGTARNWYRISAADLPVYSDAACTMAVRGERAVRIEAHESGRSDYRLAPTAVDYVRGAYVRWQWDLSKVSDARWVRLAERCVPAWSSAGYFAGATMAYRGRDRLVRLSIRPRDPRLRPGDRCPIRVLGVYSDGYADVVRDVTNHAVLDLDNLDVAKIDRHALSGRTFGVSRLTARLEGLHASTTIHVGSTTAGNVVEYLGGVRTITGMSWSPHGLLIVRQTGEILVLRDDYELEVLASTDCDDNNCNLNSVTSDANGVVYARAIGVNRLLRLSPADGFSRAVPIALPDGDATIMAVTASPAGIIIGDHRGGLWRVASGETTPRLWTRISVMPVALGYGRDLVWALGGSTAPGLVALDPSGAVQFDALADTPISGLSAFHVRAESLVVTDFIRGSVLELTGDTVTTIATGLVNPTAVVEDRSGGLLVANFGGDSVARVLP